MITLTYYNNLIKKNDLLKIIKIYNLKNCSTLNKNDLLILINKQKACMIIQRMFRKKICEDKICPITLTAVSYPFICIKNYNTFRYYSLIDFVKYLNKSPDDFRDPISREPLSDNIIKYIESLIKYYNINKISNKKKWNKKIKKRNDYLNITKYLHEILDDLFSKKSVNFNYIYNTTLPQFIYYFHFLIKSHRSSCFMFITNYINCISYHSNDNKIYIIDYLKLLIKVNNL